MHNATVPTRIQLDDGGPIINVDPTDQDVEVTISCNGRAHAGIALTRTEARRLAIALMDASAPSLADGDPAEVREHIAFVKAAQPTTSTSIDQKNGQVSEGAHGPEQSKQDHEVDTPGEETERDTSMHGWYFPLTRNWKGEQVPSSEVKVYRTVNNRDIVEVEFVDTPEGPIMLIDGRRPISLDDTHRLMTDVALYRHETDAVNAFIRRREGQAR